ncbi:MAG: class I SAM-dependent methyltransferase [Actinomycetota bacterium]
MTAGEAPPTTEAELRSYYEAEAGLASRKARGGVRADLVRHFAELVAAEGRRSVVDFGSGPGHDLAVFAAAGLDAVGVDLAIGNARLAAELGATVLPGSILRPPLRRGSMAAGWSTSVLMHLDADECARALAAMVATLEPGAPLLIGMWGRVDDGTGHEVDAKIAGERRSFHARPLARNRALLAGFGRVEQSVTRDDWGPDPSWRYQLFRLRTAASR